MLLLKNQTVGLSSVVKPTILIHLKSKTTMNLSLKKCYLSASWVLVEGYSIRKRYPIYQNRPAKGWKDKKIPT